MPWTGLLKPPAMATCRHLRVCFEDPEGPGWLVRLYDNREMIGEALADDPQRALEQIVAAAREYLHAPELTSADLVWVQT